MLMHDRPSIADLAKARGQTKVHLTFIPISLRTSATHQGSDKSYVVTRSNAQLLDVKDSRVLKPRKKINPTLSVSSDALQLNRRWNVEHQNLRGVISENPIEIPVADCRCPTIDQAANLGFIGRTKST
jgi:hypothetical protein